MSSSTDRPDWLVEDLGPKGAAFVNLSDFAVPPEESHGSLFLPDRLAKGYHVEEIRDGVYWVSVGWYDCMFVTTGSGVIVLDAPPALGENLLAAIEEVTDEPVTHVIYSHWHADHIGAAAMFGANVQIIAHEKTKELLERFPDPFRPVPTETFSKDATLEVGGVRLELSYKGQNHCEGNIFVHAPAQKVLAAIDIASPAWVTFRDCDSSENLSGWEQAHHQILEYDFDTLISGHVSKLGNRDDVVEGIEYIDDLVRYSREALETIPMEYFHESMDNTYRAAFRAVEENYFAALVNYVTKKTLERTTSNGKRWEERLNGADVLTKHNAFSILEKTRLERTHNGYMRRDGSAPEKFFI
ncbi:MBL fold metallo-hydrolase [Streptomyces sp. NPDC088725]|uniref:MBL fold metallo-hydrolase n=1 Tax=Streptomyces sp. NPDC088725 TaxID=3365873 RepID=UPI00380DC6D4